MNLVPILSALAWIVSFICTLYAGYYTFVSLFAFKRPKKLPATQQLHRFLILIAARNEAAVIGNLVDSLNMMNYPRESFDIVVMPNNCTDLTREVALTHGARIFDCTSPVRSKGEVLDQFFAANLDDSSYDAYCIFDADNLVHPDFLASMNRALASGHQVAQGYRDSKNPVDTAVSASYSINYWMFNRFYNQGRVNLGLSALISGCGFMISRPLLQKLGGWKTKTLTEDLEIATLCVLAGEKVHYLPDAVFFDEQPLTFKQSWHQRLRWSTGIWQIIEQYLTRLAAAVFFKHSRIALDQLLFFLAPLTQLSYALSFILNIVLQMLYVRYNLFPERNIYSLLFLSVDISYLMTTAIAGLTVFCEKKQQPGMLKGILFYWLFIFSWFLIVLRSLFKRTTTWTAIVHTRSINLQDVLTTKN